MKGTRQILHLVIGDGLPPARPSPQPGDTVVELPPADGDQATPLPVIVTEAGERREIDDDRLVRLIFEHDVLVGW